MLYLEEQANKETALRYHKAVKSTARLLARQPLSGKRFELSLAVEHDVRFPVAGPFSKYLVFYQVTQTAIDIVRVLHGSRNIQAILADEPNL